MHSELEFDAAAHNTDVVIMHLENIEELLWRIIARKVKDDIFEEETQRSG